MIIKKDGHDEGLRVETVQVIAIFFFVNLNYIVKYFTYLMTFIAFLLMLKH